MRSDSGRLAPCRDGTMAGVKVYGKIHTARFGKVFRPRVSLVRVRV